MPTDATTATVLPRLPMLTVDEVPAEYRAAYQGIADSRHGMPTSFATFFNSPVAAVALGDFGGHLRFAAGLTDEEVEVVVMEVAATLRDDYMWAHHFDLAHAAGLSDDELDAMKASATPELSTPRRTELAAFAAATVQGEVTDDGFAAAGRFFSPKQLVDIIFCAAYYQMLHHIFGALRIVGDHDTRQPTSVPPFGSVGSGSG